MEDSLVKDVCTSRRDNCVPCMDKLLRLTVNTLYVIYRYIPPMLQICITSPLPTNQNPNHNTVNSSRTINFLNLFSTVYARWLARKCARSTHFGGVRYVYAGTGAAFSTNHNNQNRDQAVLLLTSNNIYT